MKNWLAHILLLFLTASVFAQKGNDLIYEGNKLYEKGEFGEAEVRYRKAEEEKGDGFISKFNLGDALFRQERYEEAAAAFQQLPSLTEDKKQKAAAYHNLGNSLMKMEKYKESVDAYKQALRHDPKDDDTKYNLSYARRMIQEQQEQQQQQQDQNEENKDDKQEDQQQQQQQQDKENEEEQKDDQQQQQPDQGDEEQEQQEQQQPRENEISREDAERMLDAINQDEQDIRERMDKKQRGPKRNVEKDW